METLKVNVNLENTIFLLFRDKKTTSLNIERRNLNDDPVYLQRVKDGKFKGDFVNIINGNLIAFKGSLKYACVCDENLRVKTFFNDDLKPLSLNCFYQDIPLAS